MQLVCDAQRCVVEDLNSTNGVFIDEVQVKKRQLQSGDVISVGVHELVYTDIGNSANDEADTHPEIEDAHDNVPPVVNESPPSWKQG